MMDIETILVKMKVQNNISGSLLYEEGFYSLPDKWTIGKLVDCIVLCKLENGETVLSIELEEGQ